MWINFAGRVCERVNLCVCLFVCLCSTFSISIVKPNWVVQRGREQLFLRNNFHLQFHPQVRCYGINKKLGSWKLTSQTNESFQIFIHFTKVSSSPTLPMVTLLSLYCVLSCEPFSSYIWYFMVVRKASFALFFCSFCLELNVLVFCCCVRLFLWLGRRIYVVNLDNVIDYFKVLFIVVSKVFSY